MTMYVCHKTEEVWHWCRNCPDFPHGNYVVNRASVPPPEAQCPRCSELDSSGQCEENGPASRRSWT